METNKEKALKRFKTFISFRNKFSLSLSIIVFVAYYAFILAVGLDPDTLGIKFEGTSITIGILLGLTIIVTAIALTGIYTLFANKYFDKEQEECIEELNKSGLTEDLKSGKITI